MSRFCGSVCIGEHSIERIPAPRYIEIGTVSLLMSSRCVHACNVKCR